MLWRDVPGIRTGYRPCAVNDDFTRLVWLDTEARYSGDPRTIRRTVSGQWQINANYGWSPFNGIGPALEAMYNGSFRGTCNGCNELANHCLCETNGIAHLPPSVQPTIMLPICALTGCHKPILKGEGTKSYHSIDCWKKSSALAVYDHRHKHGMPREASPDDFLISEIGSVPSYHPSDDMKVTINGDYIDEQENL